MFEKNTHMDIEELEVETLDAAGVAEAVEVIVRGMRDNPQHVAAFGEVPEVRQRKLRRLFGAMASSETPGLHRTMLALRGPDGAILGVCGMAPSDQCQPGLGRQLRMVPALLGIGPRCAGRVMKWLGTWSRHDPEERHSHLGPVAVDAHLQGMGIGSRLMREYCARMDAAGEEAYLETDKEINVSFYERFGFEVVAEEEVLGVPNWFMVRHPSKR